MFLSCVSVPQRVPSALDSWTLWISWIFKNFVWFVNLVFLYSVSVQQRVPPAVDSGFFLNFPGFPGF